MDKALVIHDLPSDVPGKTWKEKNLAENHTIKIGTLVEINYEEAENRGVRLFVCGHTRDCDGTPLYSLTWSMEDYKRYKGLPYTRVVIGGYSFESLKIINQAPSHE
jgi:hypothetical protein